MASKSRKSKRNRFWCLILSVGMLLSLVGCGQQEEGTNVTNAQVDTETAEASDTRATVAFPKEEIVIGTLYDNQELQTAAVMFNLTNDQYHVTIKTYIDNVGEISYEDAVTNIKKELISGTNCPDALDLSQLNAKQLTAKGAIEDLTPYLEQSTLFDQEDFVDNLLEGFTYDGKLVAIPTSFTLSTIVGKTSEVGVEMGWSLEEMIALAQKYPDSQLISGVGQGWLLYNYMTYHPDAFIDWSTGECHFNSDEFRELLEFAATLPSDEEREFETGKALIDKKRSNEILLEEVYNLFDFYQVQLYPEIYGEEVTYIGFPTSDGSVGTTMNVSDALYGITAKSQHKEGAWAFIESYLDGAANSTFSDFEFPALKEKLQDKIDNIYHLDANGERILDENGDPMPVMTSATATFDDWEFVYHTPTEEEIELVLEIISVAKPRSNTNSDQTMIYAIIHEEAAAYFEGQKTLDEVIDIIQNRAQLYVSENS